MKQSTRIEKLMHSKRMKKFANVATIAMLVCPLAIGAVNALANTEDAIEPASAKIVSTEETAVSEAQPTVESTDFPVESTEPLWSESSESIPSSTEEQIETSNIETESTESSGSYEEGELQAIEEHRLILADLLTEHYARKASEYTPESWNDYTTFLNSPDPNHQGTKLEATQKIVDKEWFPHTSAVSGGYVYSIWPDAKNWLVNAEENTSPIVSYKFSADKTSVKYGEWVSFNLTASHVDGTSSSVKIGTDGKAILSVNNYPTDGSAFSMNWDPGVYEAKVFSYGGTNNGVQLGETILITVVSESNKPDITKLKELYDKYLSLNEDDYHPLDWANFKSRIASDVGLLSSTESIVASPNSEVAEETVADLNYRWESNLRWLSPDLKTLQARYDQYLSLVASDYTSASWQAFQDNLRDNYALAYTEIDLKEESIGDGLTVEPIWITLERWDEAFALLVFKDYQPEEWMKPYYEDLKEILAKYNGLVRADYTDSSYRAMEEYFNIGKDGDYIEFIKYLIDSGKTPDIPDLEAWFKQKIEFGQIGFNLLVKKNDTGNPTAGDLNLTEARKVYNKYKGLLEKQYTPESWKAMQQHATYSKAVNILETWLNKDPSFELSMSLEMAQSTIDTSIELLNDAMNMLVKAPTENKDLDLTKLQAIYDSIGDKNQYTEKSWKEFTDDSVKWEKGFWLTEAKRLLIGKDVDWDNLDQAYIDKIAKGLQNAIDTILVKKDSSGDNGNNSGNSNNQGNGNNGSTNVNNQNNNSSGSNQSGGTTNASKPSSDKKLPETGEKETFVMFLTGIVALGLTIFSIMRKREDSL